MSLQEHIGRVLSGTCAAALTIALLPPAGALALPDADDARDALDVSSVPGELIVVYERNAAWPAGGISLQSASSPLADYDVIDVETVDDQFGDDGSCVKVELADDEDVDEAIERLSADPSVAYAQRNFVYYLNDDIPAIDGDEGAGALPNDPSLSSQYYLDAWEADSRGADVTEAWKTARAQGDVTIAILDTGILPTHEDLAANIDTAHMRDIYSNTPAGQIVDYVGHGTHVAGIAAGVADNGIGIAGASYNARILPIKVFSNETDEPGAETYDMIRAFNYLEDLVDSGELDNLHVVNMSLGGYYYDSYDDALRSVIAEMRDTYQVLTVCSGGNGDDNGNALTTSSYPSDFEECFSVTALTASGTNTAWSDYNSEKDISAPGANLYSTYNSSNSGYTSMSGTSMAAPLVSGIAALLWAVEPDLEVSQVREAIINTAHPLDPKGANYHANTGSAGAIDAADAVDYVLENFVDDERVSLRNAQLETVDYVFFNGEEQCPQVTVTLDGTTLVEGVDYEVSYASNVSVGTARITVTGIGAYRGSKAARFSICHDLSQTDRITSLSVGTKAYTGSAIAPTPRVYYDGTALAKGVDYRISYRNNIYGPQAIMVLEGIGAYRGSCELFFDITGSPVDASALAECCAKARALLGETAVYEGDDAPDYEHWAQQKDVNALSSQLDGADALLAKAGASQRDIDSCVASLSAAIDAFEAARLPHDIADADVTGIAESYVYTGEAIEPAVEVTYNGKTLGLGVDYACVCENNIEPGQARMVVAGQGRFAGEVSMSFEIAVADTSELEEAIDQARTLMASVTVSPDGAGLAGQTTWATADDCAALQTAIDAAQDVCDARLITDSQIRETIAALQEGVAAFEACCQTTPVDGSVLAAAVQAAREALESTKASATGSDVVPTANWTSSDQMGMLERAVNRAEVMSMALAAFTQEQVDAQAQALQDALDAFNGSLKQGTAYYDDVKDSSKYYFASIYALKEVGLMTGVGGTMRFGVGSDLSRAELAAIMYRIAGSPASSSVNQTGMKDVKSNQWYTAAANWAVKSHTINGSQNKDGSRSFNPSGKVTLEMLVAVLGNAGHADEVAAADVSVLKKYSDGPKVTNWARESVAWAVARGIVGNGKTLDSLSSVKRERVATIIANARNAGIV